MENKSETNKKMKKYKVTILRTEFRVMDFEVFGEDESDAIDKATNVAYNTAFPELLDAEYSSNGVWEYDEENGVYNEAWN